MVRTELFRILVVGLVLGATAVGNAADEVSFNRDIRPLLSDRCFQCHGPDEKARQAELRLDSVAAESLSPFRDRDGSRVIVAGDPHQSTLWQRITSQDEAEQMPPPDSQQPALTGDEKDLIRRWIAEGASYESFWAFTGPARGELLAPESSWAAGRIDSFVQSRLHDEQRTPQRPADRRGLIRRVTLDLTGLPPGLEDIASFLADESPNAYASVVDRLLASPRYGEHMAKYWLDLVRFADTNGIHHDHYREMTPYRDWVIRAFNTNLAFDEFVTYQVAGDLYRNPTTDQQIASGFNRLHLVIDRGTALPEESYTRNVVDRVSAFGTTFLGMTLGCAVCHDHKYDPISQRDFYQLFAFFNNIDAEPETPGRSVHPPFLRLPSPNQQEELEALDDQISSAKSSLAELKKELERKQEASDREDALVAMRATIRTQQANLKSLQDRRGQLEKAIPVTLVMKERGELRPAFILKRGAYDQPGEQVERGTPDFLPPLKTQGEPKSRMDLARWLTDSEHPLTARVAVNRLWQQFFGVGIVKTSEDFGAQGEFPSHPELLDDLALEFVNSGWNVKALVREMVLSETYRQSSRATGDEYRADPDNRLLARGGRYRLDSEMIRDQILFTSGLLNEQMYGKSVKPPQPPGLWKSVSMVSSSTYSFEADAGDRILRRSLYSFWKRAMPPPQMTIFDAPTRESCIARRERTNTPVQALVLMNEAQYFDAAIYLAIQLLRQGGSDDERLSSLYERITSRIPDAQELASLRTGLHRFHTVYRQDAEAVKELLNGVPAPAEIDRVELSAYALLVNSLFNLDVVKTRE